jgi:hypothetical protein
MRTQSATGTVRRPQAVKENRRNTNTGNPPVKVTYQRKPMAYKGNFAPVDKSKSASTKKSALHLSSFAKRLLTFFASTVNWRTDRINY